LSFEDQGFELITSYLQREQLSTFNLELGTLLLPKSVGGIRNAEKKYPSVAAFINSPHALSTAKKYLDNNPKFVRAILFNKNKSSNWSVTWHQDKTVAVSKKFSECGWGPWSTKDKVLHVQPPISVLNSMVTFRVHLDSNNKENGCLSIVPGSHKKGLLGKQDILELAKKSNTHECIAPAGSALVMRPHLIHSSCKGTAPTQRRVLHIEYTSYDLPSDISWGEHV